MEMFFKYPKRGDIEVQGLNKNPLLQRIGHGISYRKEGRHLPDELHPNSKIRGMVELMASKRLLASLHCMS